ncbi:hypothetical protein GCM10020295_50660 [Streptomyces cinereospinus]
MVGSAVSGRAGGPDTGRRSRDEPVLRGRAGAPGMPRWSGAGAVRTAIRPRRPNTRAPRPGGGTLTRHIRTTTRTGTGTHTAPKGRPMPLEAGLLEILACPACHAPSRSRTPS